MKKHNCMNAKNGATVTDFALAQIVAVFAEFDREQRSKGAKSAWRRRKAHRKV